MATSNIYLYEIDFKASQNGVLDNIETYLTSIGNVGYFTNFQYIKHDLDITIKIPYPQYRNTSNNINYVKIVNSDDYSFPYYYYVNKPIWKSQDTIELSLSLDTLNTFKDFLVFGNNTVIHRQHIDRFIKPTTVPTTSFTATRIINRADEGLTGLVKYKAQQVNVQPYMKKWYLVYCTDQSGATAVNCYLVPEIAQTYTQPARSITIEDLVNTYNYGVFVLSNNTFTVYGINYSSTATTKYVIYRTSNTAGLYEYDTTTGGLTPVFEDWLLQTEITFNGDTTLSIPFAFVGTDTFSDYSSDSMRRTVYPSLIVSTFNVDSTSSISVTLDNFTEIDRTLSYLIKIIECPYPPVDIQTAIDNNDVNVVYTFELNSTGMRVIKLNNLETDFNISIASQYNLGEFFCTIPASTARANADKDITYESKMYNSATFSRVLMYDSFALELPFENFKGADGVRPSLDIYYKQSNAINSALYFKFDVHDGTWYQTEALENVMVCNRNNEMPIYNSSYLDYIRTGYNFDKKAKDLQASQGWLNTALSVGGSALSFAASGITKGISVASGISLVTNSINSIASTKYSEINARNQIEQKKAEAKATASTIQTSDDLNLLNGYLGNKLYSFTYMVSANIMRNVFNLYYLTGYAYEETGVPNTSSRYRFNYLQCEPDLVFEKDPRLVKYIEDIKERFRLGVTYFHRYDDFRQTKENWEVWLM